MHQVQPGVLRILNNKNISSVTVLLNITKHDINFLTSSFEILNQLAVIKAIALIKITTIIRQMFSIIPQPAKNCLQIH